MVGAILCNNKSANGGKALIRPSIGEALKAFDGTDIARRLEGANVLIKANFVDPKCPSACTTPDAISTVARWAFYHKASSVLVGDDGCCASQNRMRKEGITDFSKAAGEMLGVTGVLRRISLETGGNAGYLEMPSLGVITYNGIPLRDTSEFLVINLTLPKVHGSYEFSGACKNLIGLIPAEERAKFAHPETGEEMRLELKYEKAPDGSLVPLRKPIEIDVGKEDRKRQAGLILNLAEHAKNAGNFLLHIIDGSAGLLLHEHFGKIIKLGFAAAGTSPLEVDRCSYGKLGIPAVFYLNGKESGGKQFGIVERAGAGGYFVWTGLELPPKKAAPKNGG